MFEQPRDSALDQLERLVGAWISESTHPMLSGVIPGRATFEWLAGKRFLIWRSQHDRPNTIPSAIAIIGGGDTSGRWPTHYFDERGVERVYTTSFVDGVWRMWRDHPGFSQRWSGVFEDDRTIRVATELQQDGPWKPDLQVTYRRV
jgi:hypothetical protein